MITQIGSEFDPPYKGYFFVTKMHILPGECIADEAGLTAVLAQTVSIVKGAMMAKNVIVSMLKGNTDFDITIVPQNEGWVIVCNKKEWLESGHAIVNGPYATMEMAGALLHTAGVPVKDAEYLLGSILTKEEFSRVRAAVLCAGFWNQLVRTPCYVFDTGTGNIMGAHDKDSLCLLELVTGTDGCLVLEAEATKPVNSSSMKRMTLSGRMIQGHMLPDIDLSKGFFNEAAAQSKQTN